MLRLLGEPHVELADGPVPGLPAKLFVLIALLSLKFGGVAGREQLRELLWEDASPESSSRNLRWVLVALRRFETSTGARLIEITTRTLARTPGTLTADIDALLRTGPIDSRGQLEEVLDAYRGELLQGLDGQLEPRLLDLVRELREDLRRRYVGLCLAAAERTGGEAGEGLLRRLSREAPDDDAVAVALFRHIRRERGEQAALAEFKAHGDRIAREAGATVSLETRAMVAQLIPSAAASPEVKFGTTDGTEPYQSRRPGIPRVVLLPPTAPFNAPQRGTILAQALVEDVNLHLSRMRSFAIFAPHTAQQIEGLDPVTAVAPFRVGYVAVTRLLPSVGGGHRLSLAFIHTGTRQVLFADQFEFDEMDPGAGFAELAQTIARQLASVIEDVELAGYRATGEASAYAHSLLGSRRLKTRDLPSLRRARRHFQRALELTPRYVPALAGLARTYSWEALALRRTEHDLAERAMTLADDALSVDPLDPSPWREKALASLYLHDIEGSLEHLRHARKRARHHADILAETADVMVHASRAKEAKSTIEEAIALNPLCPDMYLWTLGSAEFFLGQYDQAVSTLLKMQNTDDVSRLIAASAAMAGNQPLASKYRRRWMEIYPDSRLEGFAQFMPHTNKADVAHYVDALKKAGFR